jgi:hypothetical protein
MSEDFLNKWVGAVIFTDNKSMQTQLQGFFRRSKIWFVGDLLVLTEVEMRRTPGMGEKSVQTLQAFLERHNLTLGMDSSFKGTVIIPEMAHERIEDANFGLGNIRIQKILKQNNIVLFSDLLVLTEQRFLSIRGFSTISLNDVKAFLTKHDLTLGMLPPLKAVEIEDSEMNEPSVDTIDELEEPTPEETEALIESSLKEAMGLAFKGQTFWLQFEKSLLADSNFRRAVIVLLSEHKKCTSAFREVVEPIHKGILEVALRKGDLTEVSGTIMPKSINPKELHSAFQIANVPFLKSNKGDDHYIFGDSALTRDPIVLKAYNDFMQRLEAAKASFRDKVASILVEKLTQG